MKNQIASVFGDEVFEAIAVSHIWNQDPEEMATKCVKVDSIQGWL